MRFIVDECTGPFVAHWLRKQGHQHNGVVLLRLDDERSINKIEIIRQLLEGYADQLIDSFVTVTETQVRFARR